MDISKIFQGEHGMLIEEELIPLYLLSDEQLKAIRLSQDILEEISDILHCESEFLYFDKFGGISPFCYWNGLFYYRFMTLEPNYLQREIGQNLTMADLFKKSRNQFHDFVDNQQWQELFFYCDKKVLFHVFKRLKNKISVDQQKEIFLEIYKRSEYGFDRLDSKMVKEILTLPTPTEYLLPKENVERDEEDYITIYRGQTPKSTSLDKTYSWTLSKKVAHFFATRFNSNGQIIVGKVHIDNILAYLSGEEEFLVFPKDVVILDKINSQKELAE